MKRNNYTSSEKVKIVRRVLEKNEKISDVADELKINPNLIHRWKKELFERAADIFSKPITNNNNKKLNKLKEELARKDRIIAFFAEENLKLKKNFTGEI